MSSFASTSDSTSSLSTATSETGNELRIIPLGSGNEVGRSAVLVSYRNKSVMFDCGIHPAKRGLESLPFFDEVDLSSIDLCLVSHFHVDHAGAVPYVLNKTNFRGRMFMTHPTKAISKLLLSDSIRVSGDSSSLLYDDDDVNKAMERCEVIDYHQELEHNGIKFWCYNAGHVLGAAMFMIEIAGVKVLYTGDFSRDSDRHLVGAETPAVSPDVIILESTYGTSLHEPREKRENLFLEEVIKILRRGGRCLLPVFATGRAQELLLILEDYWEQHPEFQRIPIYYASPMATQCMKVYQTYINMMNENIRNKFEISNPFNFSYVSNLRGMRDLHDTGPCIVMAAPGMLQSGMSRQLFDLWCEDSRNGVIFTGYSVPETLAYRIMRNPSKVERLDGREVPMRMSVVEISFSAHTDYRQTSHFLRSVATSKIVLVHGDKNNMLRLKQKLEKDFHDRNMSVHLPPNGAVVSMQFHGDELAMAVGLLAEMEPLDGQEMRGLMIRRHFQNTLLDPCDISMFSELQISSCTQSLIVPFPNDRSIVDMVVGDLKRIFSDCVVDNGDTFSSAIKVEHSVEEEGGAEKDSEPTNDPFNIRVSIFKLLEIHFVGQVPSDHVSLESSYTKAKMEIDSISEKNDPSCSEQEFKAEIRCRWTSHPFFDSVMDVILARLLSVGLSPSSSKEDFDRIGSSHLEYETYALRCIQKMLAEQFGPTELSIESQIFQIECDGQLAFINMQEMDIVCDDEVLFRRLSKAVFRMRLALFPLPDLESCC